jgi:hypothetical protein
MTRLNPGDTFPSLTITPVGAIGRLVPDDVIGLVKYVRDHEAQEQTA